MTTTPSWYFDADGHPISLQEWARRYDNIAERVLAEAEVLRPDGMHVLVRTVWLGFVDLADPDARLFGTAIRFGPAPAPFVQVAVYDSKPEAHTGHTEMVDLQRAGLPVMTREPATSRERLQAALTDLDFDGGGHLP